MVIAAGYLDDEGTFGALFFIRDRTDSCTLFHRAVVEDIASKIKELENEMEATQIRISMDELWTRVFNTVCKTIV